MKVSFLTIWYPVLWTIISIAFTVLIKEVLKLIPKIHEFFEAKIGQANYVKLMDAGWDIWHIIEEKFRISQIIGDTVDAKIKEFESLIKQRIPGITDEDIEMVRQAIAGEINKDKPLVKAAIKATKAPKPTPNP